MKLSKDTIKIVKDHTKCINKLAYEFDVHSRTIERRIEDNEDNGPLTTVKAIQVIEEETGLTQEQILTEA